MNALILAAGYATRLYPLTQDFPKPLLDVGGRSLLDRLMAQLDGLAALERVVLVTNHRFFPHFDRWRQTRGASKPIEILDDGSTYPDDRLGAIGDLRFALERARLDDDLLVAAADNLWLFPLAEFVAAFQARPATRVCVHRVEDPERRRRTGIAVLGADDRVTEFAEKPRQPKTHWAVPPLYLFPRATLRRVPAYLDAGGSAEAPGSFLEWLCGVEPVFAHRVRGTILDIGTPESLAAARRQFGAAAF
jgi:glucose-1-phosphate thymidylyltransferase